MMPRKPAPKKPPAKPKAKPGPVEERVKIDVPWEDAIKVALHKPKPPGGWPKSEPPK
jgi:hypothetical protein